MTRWLRRALCLVYALAPVVAGAPAHADPDNALAELKTGYALRHDGRCAEAVPHFRASLAAGRTPKALLNLSDCEAQLGDLVAAFTDGNEGQALARARGDVELARVAGDQLAAIERRLPHLTIVLAGSAPAGCRITRDGFAVDDAALGAAIAVNPGHHRITVSAAGGSPRGYDVSLAEGADGRLEVAPWPADRAPTGGADDALSATTTATPAPAAPATSSDAAAGSGLTTRDVAALVIAGVGVAALGAGAVLGLEAISKNSDSNADDHCDATGCDATGKQLRNDALGLATMSTWAFALGGAAVVGGAVLYFTGPRTRDPSGATATATATTLRIEPLAGASGAVLRVGAQF